MTSRDKMIIDLYLNHPELSIKDIANKFNISTATVSRIARINNIPRRIGNSGTRLSLQQEKEIKIKYSQSVPLLSLQQEYNISYNKIKRIIKECNNVSSAKQKNPKLNENYFEHIDSTDKAYWLGWIISDGSITNNPNKYKFQLQLSIKQEDEDILHLLEKDLGVINKVYTHNKKYKRFSLGCKKIILDLEKLGITQNKTFSVTVPSFDKKFNSAFIRGLFDGDGGFTHYVRETGQVCNELSFCGNENIISWVATTLFSQIPNLKRNSITKEASIKRIRWSSLKDINLLKQYLYDNHNNHFLSRKYNLIHMNTEVTN